MKYAVVFLIGAYLLVLVNAYPTSEEALERVLQAGVPASLYDDLQEQKTIEEDQLTPLTREKRHKKTVIINQYYGGPPAGHPYGGYGGYGGYGSYGGYGGYGGYGQGGSYPLFKKFDKFKKFGKFF